MKKFRLIGWLWLLGSVQAVAQQPATLAADNSASAVTQRAALVVPDSTMQAVYEKIKTPYKYGLVIAPQDASKKADCPTVFRKGNKWYMTYAAFDGRGYETWLAESPDLLHWTTTGRVLSFSDTTDWDNNQKAGYVALQDEQWGGSYEVQRYKKQYWMCYFAGSSRGYERGLLSIGMAHTAKNIAVPHEWQRLPQPVLKATDATASWWDNSTLYKCSILWDQSNTTGHPFVMYYNARGDSLNPKRGAERIGMAVSDDMINWTRYGKDPVLNHGKGITGDAVVQRMGKLWVMFYYGAFWKNYPVNAFNRFACSYDLVHWTDWKGEDLIHATEPYDARFAHKSSVICYKGVVYHFYCAVDSADHRGIAVATSVDMGKSALKFP